MFAGPVPVHVLTRMFADGAFSIPSRTLRRCAAVDTRACSGPERCVFKCTCTLRGVRITAEREVGSSVSVKEAAQFTWCCTGSTARRLLYSPDSMQSACIRTTCSIAKSLTGDLAHRQSLCRNAVRPTHDGVSNTILLCGQIRILTAVERN